MHPVPRGQWRNKTLILYFPFICTTFKKKRTGQKFQNVCYCCCSRSSPQPFYSYRIKLPPNKETSANVVRSCPMKLVTIECHSDRIESDRQGQRKRKGFCVKIALHWAAFPRLAYSTKLTISQVCDEQSREKLSLFPRLVYWASIFNRVYLIRKQALVSPWNWIASTDSR